MRAARADVCSYHLAAQEDFRSLRAERTCGVSHQHGPNRSRRDPGAVRLLSALVLVGIQLTLFIAGGFSVMALAAADAWKRRDADSLLLMLWVLGTFIFTGFVNWTINARSVLPLIPAAGILLARRVDALQTPSMRWRPAMLAIPLAAGGRGIALAHMG